MRRVRPHARPGSFAPQMSPIRQIRGVGASLAIACLLSSMGPANAEYRIGVGDVIEVLVARIPELQRRVTVQPDGRIAFPALGSVSVVGLLPSEMEARIQTRMATKVFRQRSSDGREYVVAIEPDEVTASVAQYRPVYVKGDVSKSGELPYRPGMTVRELVAISGGYDVLRQRTENPILLTAELNSEIQGFWIELARTEARILRLNAALGGKDLIEAERLTPSPVPPHRLKEILGLEADQLKADKADYEREKAYLGRSIKQADEQARLLAAQELKEEQGTQADIDELKKVEEMFGKGALPSPRVTDARRAVLLSSTRRLQTGAQLMDVKKRQDETARQLERLDDQRRIRLLQELRVTRATLNQIQVKLQGTGEKLSHLARDREFRPELSIVRKSEKGRETIRANEDSELQPGDVVEVVLRSEFTMGLDMPAAAAGIGARGDISSKADAALPNADIARSPK
jgi:polysaccharide export outer membrane protein